MSQIVFHGCSFTWGSGLQYYYLKENLGYSIKDLQKLTTDKVRLEDFPRKVDDYRKKHHFPNLVSEHFGVTYTMALEDNGGDNHLIVDNFQNAKNYHHNNTQLHIVQLSAPMRGPNSPILQGKLPKIGTIIKYQVEEVIEANKYRCNGGVQTPLYFLCWFKEHADYIKENYPDKLIPILCKNLEFTYFENLVNQQMKESQPVKNACEIQEKTSLLA